MKMLQIVKLLKCDCEWVNSYMCTGCRQDWWYGYAIPRIFTTGYDLNQLRFDLNSILAQMNEVVISAGRKKKTLLTEHKIFSCFLDLFYSTFYRCFTITDLKLKRIEAVKHIIIVNLWRHIQYLWLERLELLSRCTVCPKVSPLTEM